MTSTIVLLLLATCVAHAELNLFDSDDPVLAKVPAACSKALTTTIACDSTLFRYAVAQYTGFIDPALLEDALCAATCTASLASYHQEVADSCDVEPMPGYAATFSGDFVWAYQNQTCLKDSSTQAWCNNIYANFTISQNATCLEELSHEDLCSDCVISMLKESQLTGLSNYDNATATSWAAIQSTCSLGSAYPTQVPARVSKGSLVPFGHGTGLSTSIEVGMWQPSYCLSGQFHTVRSGDTCQSIAEKHAVATGTLQILNGIYPDCSNLEPGQRLCLPQPCRIYNVKNGDTCFEIAKAHSLSVTGIIGFNAALNNDCTNLLAGQNICLSPPAGAYTIRSGSKAAAMKSASPTTTPASTSGQTANNTTRKCGRRYQALRGDTCNKICLDGNISLDLFLNLNPSIDAQCSNIKAGSWYCTGAAMD